MKTEFYELRFVLGQRSLVEQMDTRREIQQAISIYQPRWYQALKVKGNKYILLKSNRTKNGNVTLSEK